MIRPLLLALCLALGACGQTNDEVLTAETGELVIYAATDRATFQPVIEDFQTQYPNVQVRYHEFDSAELDRRFRAELAVERPQADLLLSSAMDLQVRLVNDGLAARHSTANAALLPNWARWRDEALGFTFEPVVMVYSRASRVRAEALRH